MSGAGAAEAPRATGRFALVVCALAALPMVVNGAMQALFGGLAIDIRDALETDNATLGILSAATALPAVLLSPGAGLLIDRLGARRTLTSAFLGFGVCCAWFALSGSVPNSIAARLSTGIFAAFLYPAFVAVLSRLAAPESRQRGIAAMQLALGAAGIAGSFAATPILASDTWRWAIGAPLVIAIVLSGILWRALDRPELRGNRAAGAEARSMTLRRMWSVPDVRRACMLAAGTGGVTLALGALLNVTAARLIWKLPEASWGTMNASFWVGYACGGAILARLTRSLGIRRTVTMALTLLAAAVAMLAFVPPGLDVVAACITTLAAGLGGAAMSIAVTVAVRSVPIQAAGTAAGLAVSAMHCTSMLLQSMAMLTTRIPGTDPVGRAHACATVIIVLVIATLVVARRIPEQAQPPGAR